MNRPDCDERSDSADKSANKQDELPSSVTTDDGLSEAEDPESDNFDHHAGLSKAKALAMTAILGKNDHAAGDQSEAAGSPVPYPEVKEDDPDSDLEQRTTQRTVSTHTPSVLDHINELLAKGREESKIREDRLNKSIEDLNGKLHQLITLVEKQTKILDDERSSAQDRETRLKKKIQNLEDTVSRLSEVQEKTLRESNEGREKIARQLSDLKSNSTLQTEMSEKLTGLTTLMERQAIEMEKGRGAANELRSSFAEHRTEAGDREVRYTRQISNLKTQISTLEGKMDEMTAEAEKSEHRLSTALAKLKQQSHTPKSPKAPDTPTPGVHSAHTGNPKRRDVIEKLPEAVVDAKQRTDEIRTLSNYQDKPESKRTPENAQKTNPEISDEKRKERMQSAENNEWVDTSKRRRKKESAPEQQPNKPLGKLLGAPGIKRKAYFVGGIHPECAAEDLRQFCETRCKVIKCTLMPARKLGTQCAHVVVTADTAEAFEATNWEEHIFCRPWRFSSNSD